jgi:HK97 family phage prohead protease
MNNKDSILQRMKELVEEIEQAETAQSQFQTGDIVSFQYEGTELIGLIEAYDDETMTVRVQAVTGDDLQPTDDVRTIPYDSASKYPKVDNPEPEGDEAPAEDTPDEDAPEEDQEPKDEKAISEGLWVEFNSKAGKVMGIVNNDLGDNCEIEVYKSVKDVHEATGVLVTHLKKDVALCERQDYEIAPLRLMAKLSDFTIGMPEQADSADVGVIKGLASTYGNVDLGGDVVTKGAFTQTLNHKNGRVKMYFDHSYRVKDIAGVAFLKDSENGLMLEGDMPLTVRDVKEGYEKIKFLAERGERMGLSIGYNIKKSRMREDGVRELKEIALEEVSITPFPMNTEALIYSAKARKIGYQAQKSAWQTIVQETKSDAPEAGNQLSQGELKSLVDEIATFIQTPKQ